jgi:cupin fold WbuC family metalloprotein
MELKKINDEVFYLNSDFVTLNRKQIDELEAISSKTPRRRARICTHKDQNDILQEMFIVHYKDTYVRPHSHQNKIESFHVLSGEADIFIFNPEGKITTIVELGDYNSGKNFYYRINPNIIHCLLIKSDVFIFHESTLGPFTPSETTFPDWSPTGHDEKENHNFMEKLRTKIVI